MRLRDQGQDSATKTRPRRDSRRDSRRDQDAKTRPRHGQDTPRRDQDATKTRPRRDQDATKTRPRRGQDAAKTRPRRDQDATKTRPRRGQDAAKTRPRRGRVFPSAHWYRPTSHSAQDSPSAKGHGKGHWGDHLGLGRVRVPIPGC